MNADDSKLNDLQCYWRDSNSASGLRDHIHACHELILVEDGLASFSIQNKRYIVGKNTMVIIGDLEQHDMKILQFPYQRYVLTLSHRYCIHSISDPLLASFILYRPKDYSHVLELDEALFQTIKQHFVGIMLEKKQKFEFWQTKIHRHFEDILIELYRAKPEYFLHENSHTIDTVFRVQQYIAEHFADPITLELLAKRFYISKYYLLRSFQNITGYSIQEYVYLYRINQAKRLLETTNMTINEIAPKVGYADVNHFIRTFKRSENITPLRYRKTMQEIKQ